MTDKTELLACPFCGGSTLEVASFRAGGVLWWQVECAGDECQAHSGDRGSEASAIKAWNTRATLSPQPSLSEQDVFELAVDIVSATETAPLVPGARTHAVEQLLKRHVSALSPPHDRDEVERLYSELIMNVSRKYEGESRHETALRYIREREADAEIGEERASLTNNPGDQK